jgi:LysM repeat protein
MAARVARCAVWLLLSALLVGACGGGDGESDSGEASAAPTAAAQEEPSSAPSQAAGSDDGDDAGTDDGQTYVVKSGDTLSAIAQRFDTTVQAIVRANDISDPDVIDVGQRLRIPGG